MPGIAFNGQICLNQNLQNLQNLRMSRIREVEPSQKSKVRSIAADLLNNYELIQKTEKLCIKVLKSADAD